MLWAVVCSTSLTNHSSQELYLQYLKYTVTQPLLKEPNLNPYSPPVSDLSLSSHLYQYQSAVLYQLQMYLNENRILDMCRSAIVLRACSKGCSVLVLLDALLDR